MGYWENRQAQMMYEYMEDAEALSQELADIYAKASRHLNYEIQNVYEKFRDKHGLTDKEAKALLNTLRDSTSIEELKQALAKDPKNADLLAEMESGAYRARIERMEQLQIEIDRMMQNVYEQEKKITTAHYVDLASNSYYRQIYEIQRKAGFQFSFAAVDPKAVAMVLGSKWSGENYSTRIWNNTKGLAKDLKEQIIIGLLTGKTGEEMSRELANKYATGAFESRRLVRTESNFVNGQMQLQAYEECEAEQYEFVAVLDLRTSDICRELDGKVFYTKDAVPGKNMNPMHPFCRSTTIIHLDDAVVEGLKRRARNPETGKNEFVKADMNYGKWYKQNVANNPKAKAAEKMIKNRFADKTQYEKYKEVLGKKAGKTFADFQELKYNKGEEWQQTKGMYRKINAYNKFLEKEPQITADMRAVSEKQNVEMKGLENRIKTKESYLRKLATDTKNSVSTDVIKNAIENAHDVIRYTYQADSKKYVAAYNSIVEELKGKGYTLKSVKNTWKKGQAYKGINTTFQAPDGTKFEVQFHTPESFELKNGELHKLYEEYRKDSTTAERRAEILGKMSALSVKLETPEGIESIR